MSNKSRWKDTRNEARLCQDEKTGVFYGLFQGKKVSFRTSNEKLAEREFSSWIASEGLRVGLPNPGAYTLSALWAVFWVKHAQHQRGASDISCSWSNLKVFFGHRTVLDVNQANVDAYTKARMDGTINGNRVVAATVRKEILTLLSVINFCIRPPFCLIPPECKPLLMLPKPSIPRERILTMDELKALFASAAVDRNEEGVMTRLELFLWIALETGARLKAIMELEWDRVDFSRCVIDFCVPGAVYTRKKRSKVPMSSSLRSVLEKAWPERRNNLVLTNKASIIPAMNRALRRVGLINVTPHALRRTAATNMAMAGVSLWKIAKVLANSMAVTEKSYAKWVPDDAEGTVELISNGLLNTKEKDNAYHTV